tara:strand:+ start:4315 stop:5094 length:780 start_codon:yes stop_codon:yes gene_type:complete
LNRIIYIFFTLFIIISCGDQPGKDEKKETKLPISDTLLKPSHIDENKSVIIAPKSEKEQIESFTQNGITLTPYNNQITEKATLKLETETFLEGENQLSFSVSGIENYHIFVFLNGALYQANQNKVSLDLLDGNNLMVCFLTDENFTIVKQPSGIILKNIILGNHDDYFNEKQPHLLYFSPNKYSENLDFLLINTNLENHNFKVKATIDNTDFIITKWMAYQISGLKKGEHSVRLQLLDENNRLIDGPFNDSGVNLFRID